MTFWSEDRLERMRTMWLAGVGSGEIASLMPPITRNAVMGKINRLGLMGRKGAGAMADATDNEIRLKLAELLAEAAAHHDDGSPRALGIEDELAVIQTAIMVGRRSPRIAELACPDRSRGQSIVSRLDVIWPADGEPPAAWFDDADPSGSPAFLIDVMVLAGLFEKGVAADGGETIALTDRGRLFVRTEGEMDTSDDTVAISDAAPAFREMAQAMVAADQGAGRIPYQTEGMMIALAALEFDIDRDVVAEATGLSSDQVAEAIDLIETLGAWRPEMREEYGRDDVGALRAYLVMLASIASAAIEDVPDATTIATD